MKDTGAWLKVNGEAIYATRPRKGDGWSEDDTVRYTRYKDRRFAYAILTAWPGTQAVLKSVLPKPGSRVTLLGSQAALTSIAQGKNNSLTDGSYYGAAWFDREISGYALRDGYAPGSALVPLTEGITDCSEYPLWHPPYSTAYQADCKNSPAGLKGAAQTVQVRDYSPEGEWDIIEAKY